jgi:hypothetical protein
MQRGLSMIVSIFCYTDKYPAPFPKIKEKNFSVRINSEFAANIEGQQ